MCSVRASVSVITDEFLWSCGRFNISVRVSTVRVSVRVRVRVGIMLNNYDLSWI